MILFFGAADTTIIALQTNTPLDTPAIEKLSWLLDAPWVNQDNILGFFIGPRASMITPWSTNAVEITQNMGIKGIIRIEQYHAVEKIAEFDLMLFEKYENLSPLLFEINLAPEHIKEIQTLQLTTTKQDYR